MDVRHREFGDLPVVGLVMKLLVQVLLWSTGVLGIVGIALHLWGVCRKRRV